MPTIGVAIAIPEPWATELEEYRLRIGDPTASGVPTHITLIPPLDVDDSIVADIEAHLAQAAQQHDVFRVHLRGTGTFRPVSPVGRADDHAQHGAGHRHVLALGDLALLACLVELVLGRLFGLFVGHVVSG